MSANFFFVGVLVLATTACNSRKSTNEIITPESRKVVQRSDEALSYLALQQRVKEIFESKCYSCQGQNGTNAGNTGDIGNLTALAEKGLFKTGAPADQSKIYQPGCSYLQTWTSSPQSSHSIAHGETDARSSSKG